MNNKTETTHIKPFLDEPLHRSSIDICGKTLHYAVDQSDTYGWDLLDIIDLLDITDTRAIAANIHWVTEGMITPEFEILLSQQAITRLCLMSRKLEERAHLYRHTRGVSIMPSSPWGRLYNAEDMAICLGYDNPSQTIREHFTHAPNYLKVPQVYTLATHSTLPDAKEYIEKLFDASIAEHIEDYKKNLPRKPSTIPFIYKGTIIRTFVEDYGSLLFCLTDVTRALGITDYKKDKALFANLGKGAKKKRKVGCDVTFGDKWATAITEAGLDKLINRANSPEGESLKQWIANKVKPALQ